MNEARESRSTIFFKKKRAPFLITMRALAIERHASSSPPASTPAVKLRSRGSKKGLCVFLEKKAATAAGCGIL